MNQYTLIARKNIENQYDSECSIYELKPKIVNNITKDVETEVFKNKKCRISFEDIYVNTETDTEAKKTQKIKLFIPIIPQLKPTQLASIDTVSAKSMDSFESIEFELSKSKSFIFSLKLLQIVYVPNIIKSKEPNIVAKLGEKNVEM